MADIVAIGGGFGSANSYGGYAWGEATRQALQNTVLVINDTSHSHTVDNIVLVQQHTLVVQDASHSHTVDNIILVQQHTLAVDDALHGHTSDTFWLIYNTTLSVNESLHSHTADNIALVQQHTIVVSDTTHSHLVDNITLIQQHVLTVDNVSHDLFFEGNLLLNQYLLLNKPDDSLHSLKSDNLALTGNHIIVLEDASHRFIIDEPNIIDWSDLSLYFGGYKPTIGGNGGLTQAQIDELGVIYHYMIGTYGTLQAAELALGGFIPDIQQFGDFLQSLNDSGVLKPDLHLFGSLDTTDKQYGGLIYDAINYGKLKADRPTNVLSFEDLFAWLSEDGLFHITEESGNTDDKINRVSEQGILKQGTIEYGKL